MTIVLAAWLLMGCGSLRKGDLLFHVASKSNHITEVTPGMIDHVAICLGHDSVIEALPKQGVVTTPLHTVLNREEGYYVKGRVRRADGSRSAEQALRYLGLPYDSLYLEDNEAVYCSELVVMSLVDKQGRRLLQQVPMSFRDSTGQISRYWQQFYSQRGMEVPEGAPGSNPSELSQRKRVIIKKLKM